MSFSGRLLCGLAALALWLAQSLGVWHGFVHFHPDRHSTSHATPAPVAPATVASCEVTCHGHETGGALSKLFAAHDDDADCLVYDQMSHADGLCDFATVTPVLALPSAVLALLAGLAVARWHAQFQARGPPALR